MCSLRDFHKLLVELRVEEVIVPRVELFLRPLQRLAEPLKMHDLPRPQELQRLPHLRVGDDAQMISICPSSSVPMSVSKLHI